MILRFAEENQIFGQAIFDEKNNRLREDIVVIRNDRIIQPDDFSAILLKENDEVIFLPFLAGG